MTTVKELRDWIAAMPDDVRVAIDEGGLCLVVVDTLDVLGYEAYLEVGGVPDEDEQDDD